MKKDLILMAKAFIIGSSMTVPGVSGGTMAIILGIFDKLIYSLNNLTKDFKNNILYLLKFVIGACLGIGSLAFLITWLLEKFPLPASFFFVGAVVGGIPVIFKKIGKINFFNTLSFILGLAAVVGITYIPTNLMKIEDGFSVHKVIVCLIAGFICAVALILPGISTSHMLLILGMYETTMTAIKTFDILFLLILGIGVLIGFAATTKPLAYAMERQTEKTYSVILGFVVGSPLAIFTQSIFPAVEANIESGTLWWVANIAASILLLVAGAIAILSLSKVKED